MYVCVSRKGKGTHRKRKKKKKGKIFKKKASSFIFQNFVKKENWSCSSVRLISFQLKNKEGEGG